MNRETISQFKDKASYELRKRAWLVKKDFNSAVSTAQSIGRVTAEIPQIVADYAVLNYQQTKDTIAEKVEDFKDRKAVITEKVKTTFTVVDKLTAVAEDPTQALPQNKSAKDALKRIAITTLGSEAGNFLGETSLNQETNRNLHLLTNGTRWISESRDFYILLRSAQGQFLPKTMESSKGRYAALGTAMGVALVWQSITSNLRSRIQNKVSQ